MIGVADILVNRNVGNRAANWAAYYVGMEVLLRMTGGNVVWEAGKYGAIILLAVGLLSERTGRPWPYLYVVYFLVLLPSLVVVDFPSFQIAREEISFNLSGPFLLALSSVYFYNRRLSGASLVRILQSAILPLVSMIIYLMVATPDLAEIEYGTQSNFQASGGFGPNQVSTAIGLAIFIVGVGLFYRSYVVHSVLIDSLFLGFFVIRGLATFSRGGMVGAMIGVTVLVAYTAITARRVSTIATIFTFVLFAGTVVFTVWNYVNEQTEGKLQFRYEGKNYATGNQKDITSGRTEIMLTELNLFYENPIFGIGPGMGLLRVTKDSGVAAHSHLEYTRLLAEHGAFGLIAFLIMIIVPIRRLLKLPKSFRPFPAAMFAFVLFTLSHSAMRLAIPSFFYGLCLILPQVKISRAPEKISRESL